MVGGVKGKSIVSMQDIFTVLMCAAVLGISAEVTTAAESIVVGGTISTNTVWQGEVLLKRSVFVEDGVTLTVMPGTYVRFKHYRGYREPEKRLSLEVSGRLIANGTAAQPIYFTSDAPDPQNGDWSMINLHHAQDSIFSYCVIEFGQQGLCVSGGSHEFSHCVIRWHNWEGFLFQSHSAPYITYCHIVENGYPGLAAEQFCNITMDYCESERNGNSGVHIGTSTGEIRRSLVHDNLGNGLAVTGNGTLRALGVAINNNGWGRGGCGIRFGGGTNIVEVSNLTLSNNRGGGICGPYTTVSSGYMPPNSIDIGFTPDMSYELGYIPSDPDLDGYMYVYPDDETRRIVRKIGEGMGLTWSLAWDGQYLWTSTLLGTVSKLNPLTGAVLQQFTSPGPQPWGMTYDGEHLWIVDYAEKRISKVHPATGAELATYPTPDPDSGCTGVTWDGCYLHVMGRASSVIYKMDQEGNLIDTIPLNTWAHGGIAWDGRHFWAPGEGKINKYDRQGRQVGWIYEASEDTWDLTWDGQYLWASQSTNQNWRDAKIFALEILDDHDTHEPPGPIQTAINDASNGDTVVIEPGVYNENIAFRGKNLTVRSTDPDNPAVVAATVIKGGGHGSVVTFSGREDVNCVLTGLTITGGKTTCGRGGGVRGNNTLARISKCIIKNNSAKHGGGLADFNGTIDNCIISGNSAERYGGGLYGCNGFITNCTISDNWAERGGGIYNVVRIPTLTNCVLWDNRDDSGAGASAQVWGDCIINYSCVQGYVEPNEPPNQGMISHWKFDEGSGTTAYDSAGENDGTLINGPLWTAGQVDGALSFDGINDYVDCGNLGSFPSTGTIQFWMNPDEIANYRNPFTTHFAGGNAGIRFEENGNGRFVVVIRYSSSGGVHEYISSGLQAGRWYHVVLTWDSGNNNVRGYLNGVEKFNENHTNIWPTALPDVQIGRGYSTSAGRHWNGKIDEVRIYDRALSAEEILQLYRYQYGSVINQSNIGTDPCFVGWVYPEVIQDAISWWNFDEGSGTTAYDSTGSNDGVLNGDPNWTAGKIDDALSFDGANDYVEVSSLTNPVNMSYALWVKADGYPGSYSTLLEFGNDDPWFGIRKSGTIVFYPYVTSSRSITIGQWHHIAVTSDGSQSIIYIDGIADANGPPNTQTGTGLGIGYHDGDEHFDGLIDEVMIFDRALSAQEIKELYQAAERNYHLLPTSPCIDGGDPNYVVGANETDLDGNPRVVGGRIDMGAYEYQGPENAAPVACIVGGDRFVEAGEDCEGRVVLDGSCSSDADSTAGTNDDINDFDWYEVVDACEPNSDIYLGSGEVIECNLGLGEHLIILEVTDKAGAFDSNEVVITVEDVTPPGITLNGADIVVLECGVDSYVEEGATATDNCDEDVVVVTGGDTVDTSTCGTYVVTYDAGDSSGNAAEQVVRTVVVEDTMPPEFSLVVEPNILWPPNGKMVLVRPEWEVSDNCDEDVEVSLVDISMSAEGDINDYVQIGDDGSIYLRARKGGGGSGRIYTLTYEAMDDSGNVTEKSVTVTVRHSKRLRKLRGGFPRPGRQTYRRVLQRRGDKE